MKTIVLHRTRLASHQRKTLAYLHLQRPPEPEIVTCSRSPLLVYRTSAIILMRKHQRCKRCNSSARWHICKVA